MPAKKIKFFAPFISAEKNHHIEIVLIHKGTFEKWLSKQDSNVKTQISEQGFNGDTGQIFIIRDNKGKAKQVIAGTSDTLTILDGSKLYDAIKDVFSLDKLKKSSFYIKSDADNLHIGWGLAAYKFNLYKDDSKDKKPLLMICDSANEKRIKAFVESICLIRDLINTPANDMGPDELESAARTLSEKHKTSLSVKKDKELIEQNFPMIYEVGKASPRTPRLLEFTWGNKKHPKVTLVGKGVCFDTGGLDIKPSQFMLTMKKDMGGAAHVLGLAHMIMSLKLPINLRVLIPAVENSISGNSYRPSDIINSRKGLSVEVGNTDAEGRLVLADALSYACEDKPELLIDFATLTGAARIALGYDLPAIFSNNDEIAQAIQSQSASDDVDDPVWQLPLWQPYRKDLDSTLADISSTGTGKAGATNAALFLQEFITKDTPWIHMDVYAWEQTGKAGRPKGGADTGMRAIFAFLEERYGKYSAH